MSNYRVVRQWTGEDYVYTIEDVVLNRAPNIYPLVSHEPDGLLTAHSKPDLKRVLQAMLAACKQPTLELVPAQTTLKEVGREDV